MNLGKLLKMVRDREAWVFPDCGDRTVTLADDYRDRAFPPIGKFRVGLGGQIIGTNMFLALKETQIIVLK